MDGKRTETFSQFLITLITQSCNLLALHVRMYMYISVENVRLGFSVLIHPSIHTMYKCTQIIMYICSIEDIKIKGADSTIISIQPYLHVRNRNALSLKLIGAMYVCKYAHRALVL